MRALTVWQPWAGLMAAGIKLVENRSRRIVSPKHFGSRIAIHAGARLDSEGLRAIRASWPEDVDRAVKLIAQLGAVLAVATVVGVHEHGDLGDQERWYCGPIGYVLRDVRALATPVPCRGHLGLWTLPADVERAVVAQIGDEP